MAVIRDYKKVIERLCKISSEVGWDKFESKIPHDCFCGKNQRGIGRGFQFDDEVLKFIEKAVREKIERERPAG